MSDVLPVWLGHFEKLLAGKDYFVGNRISLADLRLFALLHKHSNTNGFGEVLAQFPRISAFQERVSQRPRIKKYLDSNPYAKK